MTNLIRPHTCAFATLATDTPGLKASSAIFRRSSLLRNFRFVRAVAALLPVCGADMTPHSSLRITDILLYVEVASPDDYGPVTAAGAALLLPMVSPGGIEVLVPRTTDL